MIVYVLLNLLNKLRKSDKMKGLLRILPLFNASRSWGCRSWSKTLYPLLSTSSTEKDPFQQVLKKLTNKTKQQCNFVLDVTYC